MKVLVTGATGFVGGNLVRRLLQHGYEVRALVRPGSDKRNLEGLDVEIVSGDITEPASLPAALQGCKGLFHVAASYTFWTPDKQAVYRTNVTGTENILNAALLMNIDKTVYTSSECTLKIAGATGNEYELANPDDLPGHYKRSKCMAEKTALNFIDRGLPLVIVNPTTPIGANDIKPTPTGRIILDFINRKMPAYVNTGLNVVDVDDVTEGHILAMEKGRTGERYLLGNTNLTLQEIFLMLEKITGVPAPKVRIPLKAALTAAYIDEFFEGTLLRKEPRIPVQAVEAAHRTRHLDCSKAVTELGLPQTPVEEAFTKAVTWFRENKIR